MQEERARKAAVRKSKMDADLDAESADLMEKKGVIYSPIKFDISFIAFLLNVLQPHKLQNIQTY